MGPPSRSLLVGLLLAGVVLGSPAAGAADGLAQLSFDPGSVRAEPGEAFTLDVVVNSQPQFAAGAYEIGVVLAFDRTYLRATGVERGPYIGGGGETTVETNRSLIENDEGRLVYELHREPAAGGVSGEGRLATVAFEVREAAPAGTVEIRFESARVLLTDGNLQRVIAQPASVTVVGEGSGTDGRATTATSTHGRNGTGNPAAVAGTRARASPTSPGTDGNAGVPPALLGAALVAGAVALFVGLLVVVRRL